MNPALQTRAVSARPKLPFLILAVAVAMALSACSSGRGTTAEGGEQIELTIGASINPELQPGLRPIVDHMIPEIERRVREETIHEVSFSQFWGGTIAVVGEDLDTVSTGQLDIGVLTGTFEPAELPFLGFTIGVPFASVDPVLSSESYIEMLNKNPEIDDHLADNWNVVRLGDMNMGGGQYVLLSNERIDDLGDLDGLRIAGSPDTNEWLRGTGATGLQSPFVEWYSLLQSGTADGVIMTLDLVEPNSIHEVVNYMLPVEFGLGFGQVLAMNQQTWDGLPEEVREIMADVATETSVMGAEVVSDLDGQAIATAEANGVEVLDVSDLLLETWAGNLVDLPEPAVERMNAVGLNGTKIYRDFIQAQESLGHEFPVQLNIPES